MEKGYSKIELLLAEFFEKAEDLIEDGGSAGEFTVTLAKFLGHFHNRHYPSSMHRLLTTNFAEAILMSANELRMVQDYPKELQLILIHSKKK